MSMVDTNVRSGGRCGTLRSVDPLSIHFDANDPRRDHARHHPQTEIGPEGCVSPQGVAALLYSDRMVSEILHPGVTVSEMAARYGL